MPCNPLAESQFSPGNPLPFPGIGGFAVQLPNLNIPFPDLPLDDLVALFNQLSFVLPPGIIKPHFDPDFLTGIYSGLNDLLTKFMPFLMLYKFFLPVLNLILCIIEVLCALLNPFKLPGVISRLFRTCIPEFLALFPFFALPLMILSLLLLILTLIQYLIQRILGILQVIIENLIILSKAASRLDNDSIIAIVKKVGDLLCSLQNLFVIFGVITIVIQVVKAMLSLSFKIPPCDDSDGSNEGCCTPDVCPDFIRNNSDIVENTGNFLYYNQVGRDSGLTLPIFFPPIIATIRPESWQFYDPNLSQRQAFINITHAYDLPAGVNKVFFPAGTNYTTTTNPSSTPYTISFRFFYVPADFDFNPHDPKGPRFMRIANAIVENPPTAGVSSFDTSLVAPFNGTLNLIGGVVTEDDGTILTDSQGRTISLNTFIHKAPTSIPSNEGVFYPNDGYLFSNVSYDFTINHEVLLGASLITLGCIPEVATNKNFINTTIGAQFNSNGVKLAGVSALLPDTAGAQDCIVNAINTYKQNISVDSTNQFQAAILSCLNGLQQQTTAAVAATIGAGFDQYKSTFTLDTTIQFTTKPIQVSVSLNDSSGQSMTNGLPADAASSLASQLAGTVSFGNIDNFTYDGYSFFVADITSKETGNGNVKVAFNNNFISILSNPTDLSQSPSVTVKELTYTFVNSPTTAGAGTGGSGSGTSGGSSGFDGSGDGGAPRRDGGDISRDSTDSGGDQ